MIKKFILMFLFLASVCFADYKYYLSLGAIFRDEAPYLKEWIEYHRLIGVEHFYLCSHCSTDNYREVLNPYIKRGIVELTEWFDEPNANHWEFCFDVQPRWYTEVINKSRGVSQWVTFLDSDEFICPITSKSFSKFLKDFEEFASLSINWRLFGTSHVEKLDKNKLMIEQLTLSASLQHELQSFLKVTVQPIYVKDFTNPHCANFLDGYYSVNANKVNIGTNGRWDVSFDKIVINHYWPRDEYYLINFKCKRAVQLGKTAESAIWEASHLNQIEDLSIQKFVPKLRKRMGLD